MQYSADLLFFPVLFGDCGLFKILVFLYLIWSVLIVADEYSYLALLCNFCVVFDFGSTGPWNSGSAVIVCILQWVAAVSWLSTIITSVFLHLPEACHHYHYYITPYTEYRSIKLQGPTRAWMIICCSESFCRIIRFAAMLKMKGYWQNENLKQDEFHRYISLDCFQTNFPC